MSAIPQPHTLSNRSMQRPSARSSQGASFKPITTGTSTETTVAGEACVSVIGHGEKSKLIHPYLLLWEKRPLDDPYEPFFVVDSPEVIQQVDSSWLVEDYNPAMKRFHYRRLQSLPGTDYPSYYWEVSNAYERTDGTEDLVIRYPSKKARVCEVPAFGPDGPSHDDTVDYPDTITYSSEYIAAVKAASEYNSNLASDRSELHSWLLEDEKLDADRNGGRVVDENESSSSG